jgi:hypothetical protein
MSLEALRYDGQGTVQGPLNWSPPAYSLRQVPTDLDVLSQRGYLPVRQGFFGARLGSGEFSGFLNVLTSLAVIAASTAVVWSVFGRGRR